MDLNLNITKLASDARSHYNAYELLRGNENRMNFSAPAEMCLTFSLELHVKLLLRTYDIIITSSHDISKLIDKLPDDEKKRISTHAAFHPTQQGERFFENVAQASKLFVKTRYYFEKMGVLISNEGFCATLCRVISERIVSRVPYLRYDLGIQHT